MSLMAIFIPMVRYPRQSCILPYKIDTSTYPRRVLRLPATLLRHYLMHYLFMAYMQLGINSRAVNRIGTSRFI